MTYKLEIRGVASNEILDAYDWYENQQPELGDRFLEALSDFYANLLRNPFTHSYYRKNTRQGSLRRFPYVVVYEVFDDVVVIFSVFMTSRDESTKYHGE